jgi:hypothetical protein
MIGMVSDIAILVDATAAGDKNAIITTARRYLRQGDPTLVLLGRIGTVVSVVGSMRCPETLKMTHVVTNENCLFWCKD